MSLSSEARLQRLEDIEAIRLLKATYCAACDSDHNPDLVVPLFTPDAIWEASGIAHCQGHEAIRTYMADLRASGRIRNSAHHAINPQIHVDGDQATGHWRLIMLYTANVPAASPNDEPQSQHFRIIGWYDERYTRVDGQWRFSHLACTVEENGPYELATDLLS